MLFVEGVTLADYKKQKSRQKQKTKREMEKTSPLRRAGIHNQSASPERAARHRANVDPDYDRDDEEQMYPGGKLRAKKVRKAKALGELGESAVPGKPAEKLGAVTLIPKAEQDAARERLLAKTAAKRAKMKEETEIDEAYQPIDKDKENRMYRRAGNLARTAVSSTGKKKEVAQTKSSKIVSAITRQKEKERFDRIGQSPTHNEAFVDPEQGEAPSGRSPLQNVSDHPKASVRKTAVKGFKKQMSKEYGGSWKSRSGDPVGEEFVAEEDPCWKGYTQVGMKKKGGREVPNCVPSKGVPKAKGYKKEDVEIEEAIDPKGAKRQDAVKDKEKIDVFAYDRKIGRKNIPPAPKNEEVELDEKTLTSAEKRKREEIATSMSLKDFEKRYPGRGMEVKLATATKMAKKLAEADKTALDLVRQSVEKQYGKDALMTGKTKKPKPTAAQKAAAQKASANYQKKTSEYLHSSPRD